MGWRHARSVCEANIDLFECLMDVYSTYLVLTISDRKLRHEFAEVVLLRVLCLCDDCSLDDASLCHHSHPICCLMTGCCCENCVIRGLQEWLFFIGYPLLDRSVYTNAVNGDNRHPLTAAQCLLLSCAVHHYHCSLLPQYTNLPLLNGTSFM